jgi:hypothetical protein
MSGSDPFVIYFVIKHEWIENLINVSLFVLRTSLKSDATGARETSPEKRSRWAKGPGIPGSLSTRSN